MKFTLKACLFVVASLFLTTLVSGLPQQDAKDEGSKPEQQKPATKKPHKGPINPIEQGGTAATANKQARDGAAPARQQAQQPRVRPAAPVGQASKAAAAHAAAEKSAEKQASKAAAAHAAAEKKASKAATPPPQ